jgi:SAP domain/Zn-finger in ubiquitin-hydrolases and other protein
MTDKITVQFLRSELSKRGLSTAGVKADLLLRYNEAIGEESVTKLAEDDSHTKLPEVIDDHLPQLKEDAHADDPDSKPLGSPANKIATTAINTTHKRPLLDAEDSDEELMADAKKHKPSEDEQDLYLSTIDRSVLDFDFEKLCCISLRNYNVYCCLVCGKYLAGRGNSSHAYFHSMHENHHVFMNLETMEVCSI